MRSSKQRSRSKQNRNRSVGNIVNRVFDSSGPEGKVRGTPQQIIDKYNQLARDAQLGGDRVATENFQQHAEHYTRMLAEAQREQEARREEQDRQNRERQQQNQGRGGDDPSARGGGDQPEGEGRRDRSQDQGQSRPSRQDVPADVIDMGGDDGDSGLVETPESKPAPKPRRRPRKKPETEDQGSGEGNTEAAE